MHNPDPSANFGDVLRKVTKELDDVTTQGADLPPKSDLSFHRTLDKEMGKKLDEASSRILEMAQELLALVDPHFTLKQKTFADPAEDLTERYRKNVVPSVDGLLEQTDTLLDELQGNKKKAAIQVKPALEALAKQKLPGPFSARDDMPTRTTSEKMRKPQLDFADPVNNDNGRPVFTPTLPVKHHAMVPLDFVPPQDYILPADPDEARIRRKQELEWRRHPYFYETRHLPYPTSMFTVSPVIKAAPIESTEAIWVDKPEQLAEMVEELKLAKEIGVDLEHHDKHSYHGFTCLMQISTREKDWLVDTLALRAALRELKLGGVMADPSIVKVFHGADSDIVWLQKDFDIYVVNLFDTFHATKVLEIRPHSLANLLALYCGYRADKKYQMADWRIRPLTKEMKLYAQADTHFILSIYDNLRNALLEKSRAPSPDPEHAGSPAPSAATNPQRAMREVLRLSGETALRMWSPEPYTENGSGSSGWKTGITKSFLGKVAADSEVGIMYKRIHMWRDRVAREEDESVSNIFYRTILESLAQFPPQTLAALRQRLGQRWTTASRRSEELWKVMTDAQAEWRKLEAAQKEKRERRKSSSPKASPKALPKASLALPTDAPGPATVAAVETTENAKKIVEIPASILFPQTTSAPAAAPKRSTTSKLFGSAVSSTPKAKAVPAPALKRKAASALFGATKKPTAATSPKAKSRAESSTFDDIMQGIAADMVSKAPVVAATEVKERNKLPEPETVPFVPAAQRSTLATAEMTFGSKREEEANSETSSNSSPEDAVQAEDGKAAANVTPRNEKGRPRKVAEPESSTDTAAVKKSGKEKEADGTESAEEQAESKSKESTATEVAEFVEATEAALTKGLKVRKLDEPEIVTVKKATKKSKKRAAEAPIDSTTRIGDLEAAPESAAAAKPKKRKTAAEDIPDFDYSSVPNLLDDPKAATAESSKKSKKNKTDKKVKKDKPPAISGTTFGRIPQDMSQPKGGNRSKTFK